MEIGFIGCGNMAKAMISGILAEGTFTKDEMIASGPSEDKMNQISEQLGITTTSDNIKAAKNSRIIVLSVKPQMYDKVIREIRDEVGKDQIVVTIAAGCCGARRDTERKSIYLCCPGSAGQCKNGS